MNKLLWFNNANVKEGNSAVLINKDYIVSVELCDNGLIHISLVNGEWFQIDDFCTEDNPLMAFWKYISERE